MPTVTLRRPAVLETSICLVLLAATIGYLYLWPRDFYWYDEGLVLYEAKRILGGEVMYRDFFEIVTPAVWYLLAGLFGLFGTSIETARMAMAVLHGIIVVLIYLCCRSLHVHRMLAAAAAVAYIALAFPALPNASPHWFSTCLSLVLLLVFLRRPGSTRSRWALIPGLLVGLFIAVQQQKAVVIGAGAALLFAINYLVDRRYRRPALPILGQLAWFVLGIALVTVPLFGVLLAVVGLRPLLAALVEFPLFHYRGAHDYMTWGYHIPWFTEYSLAPVIMRWLPIVLPIAAARAVWSWAQRSDAEQLTSRLAAIVLAGFSALSIYYNPNYTHVAFIAPLFFLLIADTVDWALASVAGRWAATAMLGLGTAVLVAAIGLASSNVAARRELYGTKCRTAFGEIDFRGEDECSVAIAIRARLPSAPSREVVCYPFCAGLYLLTGTTNPTPYQILQPGYSAAAHLSTAVDILERRQVPYVVILPMWVRWNEDPFVQYVRTHYRRINIGGSMSVALFERLPDASRGDSS